MLTELGRGPLIFSLIEVSTALEEKHFDLSVGDRGFRIRARGGTAVVRLSNIKGEVEKATTASPKPKFWTIPAGTHFESITGLRIMEDDAMRNGAAIDYADIADGTALEQRWYVTSETANTDIELIIIPGT